MLTGSEKAFAAGADIKEMKDLTFSQAYNTNFIASWSATIPNIRKPIIAAVNGVALGGGCELAMMADIIYCSTTATFGQPEIKLGIIPGAGGSQRLIRAVGKSRAMELVLTGRNFSGKEAAEWGVAARAFDSAEACIEGAMDTAEKIAGMSKVAIKAAKEVVNKSQELPLQEGLDFERKVFHGLFASRDQKIGTLKLPQLVHQNNNGSTTDVCLQACQLLWRRKSRNGLTSRINHHICSHGDNANFQSLSFLVSLSQCSDVSSLRLRRASNPCLPSLFYVSRFELRLRMSDKRFPSHSFLLYINILISKTLPKPCD